MTHLGKFTGDRSEVSNCRFFGVSGTFCMSTRRKFQESTDIQNLVKRLKNIVKELYENGTTKVFVATVIERGFFPEWTGLTGPIFSKIRHALNKKLRTEEAKHYIHEIGLA